ncbi:MAG: ABC transporter permease [Planctomycetaceae bacterium]
MSSALANWGKLAGILLAIGVLLGLVGAFAGNGNGASGFINGFVSYFRELLTISPRRVLALAGLTWKECIRRKALLVFVVFAVLLMFGGWFLTNSNSREDLQVSVHITFMLTTISWLILPVAMFLSCWGLPEDIRIRSIHTVVTKPARRAEIVIGRMLGFSSMIIAILLLMGFVGYVWIERQVPAELKGAVQGEDGAESVNLLACRVPQYGFMYFLDRDGLPKTTGINVGDPWLYRSFVEGNSRARAVWLFPNVEPERLNGALRIESRFEAFRTIKGTEASIREGVEAQYTLVNDPREDAFSSFGIGASFREIAEALRAGNFRNAATLMTAAAERMAASPSDFPPVDLQNVSVACARQTVAELSAIDGLGDVAKAFDAVGQAAGKVSDPGDTAGYQAVSEACASLGKVLEDHSDDLMELMPRLEVPLDPFHVTEYHEGADTHTYERTLRYAGSYEAVARFLAKTISKLNDEGKLVEGDALSSSLVDDLEQSAGIAAINAELVERVLKEELDAGKLTAADGKLAVADGSRWLPYFDQLVRAERLISQDAEGWMLEADLFDDLAPRGLLRVEVSCLDDQMYLGMARPDMFIRLKDNSFWVGYSKALLNIGLMLALVVVLGVTASCVVKGPVSLVFTLSVFLVGQFFHDFMQRILGGAEKGAGLVESAVLIFQHRNPNAGVDTSESGRQVMQAVDTGFFGVLRLANNIIPDFSTFSEAAAYIENGFDVPWASSVLPSIATFVGFLIPCIMIGTACLKFRELEAK